MSTTIERGRAEADEDAERGRSDPDAAAGSCSCSTGEPPLYGALTGRSFRCPCCLSLAADSDYHHWKYPRDDGVDVGLHLCRDCHSAVHGDRRVAVQRRRSHTSDWKDDALARLIARHRAIWGRAPHAGFRRWYNIPVSRQRVLRAIPRSFDPAVLDAATPDDDELADAQGEANANAGDDTAGDETDDGDEDAATRRLPTPNP